MRLLKPKLGRVFDGDHALARVDHLRQSVEHGRLTRTGTAGDDDVHAAGAGDLEHRRHLLRHRAEAPHHVERDRLLGELTDRDGGAAQRQRRDDDVDAAAVLEAGVGQRRGLVDAAADLVHDALGDLEQMLLVAELDLGELELALALDEGLVRAVDHDVADAGSASSSSSGPRPRSSSTSTFSSANCSRRLRLILSSVKHLADDRAEFLGQLVLAERGGGFGIDALEQARKNLFLDPVDRGFEAFGLAAACFAAGVLASC